MWNYILAPIIAFLGFPIGIFFSFTNPEEMKPGKKYFHLLQNILLTLIIFLVLEFYQLPLVFSIIITAVIFILLFYWKNKHKSIITYFTLAILLALSSKNPHLFAIQTSLIALYGLPTGSLESPKKGKQQQRKKEALKIIAKHLGFIALSIILLLFFTILKF
ncbi:hypothetical protein ISS04_01285 [Candidatus Woesearchaeota archaeon]|nr:hypothetical protein [Candidatus Woesearchaeota archaeon]